jgi:hypothetical protein
MGLMAARAATRMGSRQQYRTMSRMQRRRSYVEGAVGMRQDFQPAGSSEPEAAPAAAPAAPAEPQYMAELEQLAQLREQGVLTPEEFDAKKKQILGI